MLNGAGDALGVQDRPEAYNLENILCMSARWLIIFWVWTRTTQQYEGGIDAKGWESSKEGKIARTRIRTLQRVVPSFLRLLELMRIPSLLGPRNRCFFLFTPHHPLDSSTKD
jgi:hypothetical protein